MNIIKKITDKQNMGAFPPVTIAFLGDSVTQGCFECYSIESKWVETVYEMRSSFAERVREVLNKLWPKVQINIINSGISGDNTSGGLKRIDRDVINYHPDLVVVSYGLNDSCGNEKNYELYKNNLKEIFTKLKESGSEVIFLTQNHMAKFVSCFVTDSLLKKVCEDVIPIQNSGRLKMFFDSAKEICKEYDIPVCDGYAIWDKMEANGVCCTELLSNKINHPIREWHQYIAIKLVEMMFD